MSFLQIYYRVHRCKGFENRFIFGEVMGKSLVCCFLDSQCASVLRQLEAKAGLLFSSYV